MLRRREFLGLLPLAALAACGPNPTATDRKSLGLAYALGGKGDRNYNDALAQALPALQARFDVREYAPLTPEDYGNALSTLAAGPADLIFCVGFIYDAHVNQLAPRYERKTFCVLDGMPTPSNSFGVQFRVREACAMAGVVAADRSTSKILGFVGGSDIPPIAPFAEGFEEGARRLNANIRVLRSYIGSGAEAFTNAARGRDHALRLIRQGADVLFHAAGTSGDGVIAAARDEGRLAIGVDIDQASLARDTVITSVLKRLDVAALRYADLYERNASLPTGVQELGFAEGAVDITNPTGVSEQGANLLNVLRQEYRARGRR